MILHGLRFDPQNNYPALTPGQGDSFTGLFNDFRLRYTTSDLTASPIALLQAFVKSFIPHRSFKDISENYQDAVLFFETLIGTKTATANVPRLPRSTAFEFMQILVQTRTTSTNCCQANVLPDIVQWEPFVGLSITDGNQTSLGDMIETYYRNGRSQITRCNCGGIINKTIRDSIIRTPHFLLVYVLYHPLQPQAQIVRPALDLDKDVSIDIVEDGIVEFECVAGIQHVGSIQSGK